ncbi:hypothetical protein DPSP01_010259 [Paraphaeosphaeria sporulosa]|uniref:Cation/H+ exchanger transmembrane domain-containing protein n=1 Tax=Paraphaeosphaeria sporulosa TaxID=1460663 RepID=A0A177CUW3_9PLEO|nr:uncharacterized protein CC84DRAFT_516317 [Paraphaeosphaeria sporulosa]OAG11026.1 hypothetical protein CC84DRAFT_516317 [Paraphaeosphaeria sporulosa]
MPTLAVDNFNIVCACLGGFITLFGLVSYLLKEKFYLSEALISLIAGVIFSPNAANLLKPEQYALHDEEVLNTITLYFSRLVLGVQVVLAGVQLPSKYLKTEWKSLALLLGPGMAVMWLVTSLLIYALVPHIHFVEALAVGACVTPTDPVLSNSIVKGKFADKSIPKELQKIIVAESGANDGLGYPFLFLPLYIIQHTGVGSDHNIGNAIGAWFGETWGYTILLSIVYGAAVGWIAKELLHWAEERHYVDRESFLVFAITLALFLVGTMGMVGSDDILACFIAGNTFTWDDWFRLETMDDSFQPTIDMLLNVSVFIWFGAVCPWKEFYTNDVIPIYRLVPLGILVLLLRRPPIVFAMHKSIHQIEEKRQALYVGFFGPIGVSAIFYLYITLDFLRKNVTVDGEPRSDAVYLMEVTKIVVWFLVICSVIIHGLTIPMSKFGLWLPRSISRAVSSARAESPEPFHISENPEDAEEINEGLRRRAGAGSSTAANILPRSVYRIGRTIIRSDNSSRSHSRGNSQAPLPLSNAPTISSNDLSNETSKQDPTSSNTHVNTSQPIQLNQRAIRFPDEVNPPQAA